MARPAALAAAAAVLPRPQGAAILTSEELVAAPTPRVRRRVVPALSVAMAALEVWQVEPPTMVPRPPAAAALARQEPAAPAATECAESPCTRARSAGPAHPPGVNMIGYTTVTMPESG